MATQSQPETIFRAYKYRVFPTPEQIDALNQGFGAIRFLYNHFLADALDKQKAGEKFPSQFDMSKQLTQLKKQDGYEWLNDIPAHTLNTSTTDLAAAFNQHIKRLVKKKAGSQEKVGQLRFKKKGKCREVAMLRVRMPDKWHNALNTQQNFIPTGKWLGNLAIDVHRPIPDQARVVNARISRHRDNTYTVSIVCEEPRPATTVLNSHIGIDLGVIDTMTLSTGEHLNTPRMSKGDKEHLARLQRRLATKEKGSKNYEKARIALARFQVKMANRRRHHVQTVTTDLIRNHQIISMEDLNIKGMTHKGGAHKKGINRAMLEQGWYEYKAALEYKANWHGREIVSVDRFYPSSKLCSSCGAKTPSLTLDQRYWTCDSCGTVHDRDVNAAINIDAEGLRTLASR